MNEQQTTPADDIQSAPANETNYEQETVSEQSVETPVASAQPEPTVAETTPSNAPNITEQALSQLEQKVTALEHVNYEELTTFKQFWADAKDLNELIRSSRFIEADILAPYRQRVDAVCEKVKAHQDTISQKSEKISQTKRAYIEKKIQEAKELIPTDNQKSQRVLREALACLKDDWSAAKDLQLEEKEAGVRMTRDDHDASWLLWKQVNEECFVHFKEQKQNNYIAINNEVYTLGETVENADPRDALEGIKEFQKKLKGLVLEKTDWEELRLTLNKYWERADERFKQLKGQMKEGRMRRATHMEKRIEFWKTRQEANIQKFNELISKNFDVITRIEQHTEKLQGDLEAARSEQFKEKVSGWIKEQQDKIAAIQKANRELNEKIADIESKMESVDEEGLPDREDYRNKNKKSGNAADVKADNHQGDSTTNETSVEQTDEVEAPVAAAETNNDSKSE